MYIMRGILVRLCNYFYTNSIIQTFKKRRLLRIYCDGESSKQFVYLQK
jgi:hypothetical protein